MVTRELLGRNSLLSLGRSVIHQPSMWVTPYLLLCGGVLSYFDSFHNEDLLSLCITRGCFMMAIERDTLRTLAQSPTYSGPAPSRRGNQKARGTPTNFTLYEVKTTTSSKNTKQDSWGVGSFASHFWYYCAKPHYCAVVRSRLSGAGRQKENNKMALNKSYSARFGATYLE